MQRVASQHPAVYSFPTPACLSVFYSLLNTNSTVSRFHTFCSFTCFPQGHWYFPEEETDFPLVQEVVRVARSLRAQCHMTKERPDSEFVCFCLSLFAQYLSCQHFWQCSITLKCGTSLIKPVRQTSDTNH